MRARMRSGHPNRTSKEAHIVLQIFTDPILIVGLIWLNGAIIGALAAVRFIAKAR